MDPTQAAAELLLRARTASGRLAALPPELRPADEAAAYRIQHAVAAALGPIGGWKVGASGPEVRPNCAPMPQSGIAPSPAALPDDGLEHAVEAEVAFRLGQDLPPRAEPYGRHEVMAALATAHPAIEWLAFRFLDPDAVDRWSLLADGLTHGGFVWGEGVADWHSILFEAETVEQTVEATRLGRTGNPAGDMIRLVEWLANEGAVWAGGLRAGQFVTCGSWTGKTVLRPGQPVLVRFASLGEAAVG